MQLLSVQEEIALKRHVEILEMWGYPPLIWQFKKYTENILRDKEGALKQLSHNWTQYFLNRHPDLCTQYVPLLDKDCAIAEYVDQVNRYFNLFITTKAKYKICDDDIYNMDDIGRKRGHNK
jgi:hypothetical protein